MTIPRRLLPDLINLQAFECSARHGSFTRAALELNLTQSAVSRQIKDLETRLGIQLFERIRQRALLSDAGKRLLPDARRLLLQAEETIIRAVAAGDTGGLLSVATLPTFGTRWLTPRLGRFLALHPNTTINLASRSQRFDFEEENFDIAIHYGQPIWAGGNCTFLCSETVVPVAGRVLASRIETTADICLMPLLHLATRPKLWSDWFALNELDAAGSYHGTRFDQFGMIIEAATADIGVALLPVYLIEEELSSGRLHVTAGQSITTENSYYAVIPDRKSPSSLTNAFQDWLLDQVRKESS
ncbi:LysR substrate-binding domain-containing protein [Mesorhizobium sp. P5_C1]